jgi:hypothetical protein
MSAPTSTFIAARVKSTVHRAVRSTGSSSARRGDALNVPAARNKTNTATGQRRSSKLALGWVIMAA